MNKYAFIVIFILAVIVSFYLGRLLYKNTHDGFCRDNVSVMIFNMRYELSTIDSLLQTIKDQSNTKVPIDEAVKQKLLRRRKKLVDDLNLFYGQELFTQIGVQPMAA